jgi:ABC-type multidrug transport system ATPase subunit
LQGPYLTIGRGADCDIRIDSPVASRHHADLVWDGSTYEYVHVSKTNASLLKGRPLQNHLLRHGDVVLIGVGSEHQVSLVFLAHPSTAPVDVTYMGGTAIAPGKPAFAIGRDAANDLVLSDPQVSRRHARLACPDGRWMLEDLNSTNGTFVGGQRISVAEVEAGDIIRIGPFKLVFDGKELTTFNEARSVTLEAHHLSQEIKGARILDEVSLVALPGQLTVIAGTSGSGKSTLIDALNGLRPASSGRVLVNGTDLYANLEALRPLMGYVPQSDVLHRELPLRRALLYTARLRLPQDFSREELEARVDEVLADLELSDRGNLPIKNLSGGQQKRASIAAELLTGPPLFFLDEPTSGLDPGLTVKLMELLRRLAGGGKTIILVSHDPETLTMCDQLVFLAAGGRLAYAGPPDAALRYFEVGSFAAIYNKIESEPNPEEWKRQFLASPLRGAQGCLSPADQGGEEERPAASAPPARMGPELRGRARTRQWGWLTARYAEIMLRDTRNLAILLLQAPIIALFLVLVSRKDILTRLDNPTSASKLLLLLAVSAIWLGTINSAREIVKELSIYRRERMAGVGVWPYVLSKATVLTVLSAVQAWLLMYVVSLRVRIPEEGPMLPGAIEIYVSLFLTSLAALGLGLFISGLASTQERAISLIPLVLIPQVIFAGVIFDLSGASRVLSWLVISKWSVQLLGTTAHLPRSEYDFTTLHLLTRWLVLMTMATVSLWGTGKLLQRADSEPRRLRRALWRTLFVTGETAEGRNARRTGGNE